jgi:CO/xanthine dehydrogenase Mo-binding subunit
VTIPTAAAVANAVRHATDIRVLDTPMSPAMLCNLISEKGKEG